MKKSRGFISSRSRTEPLDSVVPLMLLLVFCHRILLLCGWGLMEEEEREEDKTGCKKLVSVFKWW